MSCGAPVCHPFPAYPAWLRHTHTFLKLQLLTSSPFLDSSTAFHAWLRSPPTPLKCVWDSELCCLITHFIFIVFPSAIWVPRVQSKWDASTCMVQLDLILGGCCGRGDGKILRVRGTLSHRNVRGTTSMRPHQKGSEQDLSKDDINRRAKEEGKIRRPRP